MYPSFKICLKKYQLLRKQSFFISQALPEISKPEILHDSVFVRHAHSEFNRACEEYRLKNKIDYDWDCLCSHPGFDQVVAYNPNYIDCPLTQKGIQQCYLTSKNLDLHSVDLILVSPHHRALQTCANILKFTSLSKSGSLGVKPPVVVQPLIAGSLWSSCDISKSVQQKKNAFNTFNFSKLQNLPELWYIENLRQSDKQKVYSQIKRRKLTQYSDKQLLVLELIRNKQIHEDRQILRQRSWQIKQEMKLFKKNHCNILLISHYYVIQYLNCKAFNNTNHKPLDDVDMQNCLPYYNNLDVLLNYK